MNALQQLDYIAILIYLLIMAGVGLFFGWFVKDIKGYFKGGSTIPWGISAISNFMGSLSTFVFVAYAGIAYTNGVVATTVIWCTVPPFIFAAFVVGRKWVRSRIITPVEYLETRFNIQTRQLFSWLGLLMRFLDNMVRQYAIGIFLEVATSFSFVEAIILSGIVTTFFTILGGVWAVVVMDTLQFVILAFVSILLVPLSIEAVGGMDNVMNNYPSHFDWFAGPKGQPLWLIAYYVMVLLKYNGNWVFIQRFYSVKNEKATVKLGLMSAALLLVFPFVFLLPAILAVDILPNLADPEQAYVATAVKLLPAGLLGLMIAAMFSATMSSLNSEFNVMSGVLTNDVYKRLINPNASDKQLILVARLNILLVGAIVVFGALFVGQIGGAFEANKLLTGLFAIPLAIPLVLGLMYRKTNSKGVALTVFIGMISGMVLNYLDQFSWEEATMIQIVSCFAAFFVTAHLFKSGKEYKDRVAQFFDKVNTPLKESEIHQADPSFNKALTKLFAISIGLSGVLFCAMSLPSFDIKSGKIAFGLGIGCLVLAALIQLVFGFKNSKEQS